MKDKSINNISELYLKLLPAQIFVVVASCLSGLINGLITGNYLSSEAMIALGFVTPLMTIFSALSTIVSGGSGILCGQFMGRGETEKVNKVFSLALVLVGITGIALTVICLIFANPIAVLCGSRGDTTAATATYIRGLAVGIIPLLVVPCLMTFLQMCNKANFSLVATIILAGFNCLFGFMNVKVMHAGIFGVGLSTSLSYYATLLVLFIYFKVNKNLVRFSKDIDFKMTGNVIKFGFPGALASILYSLRNMIINTVALDVSGTTAVNALAILGSCGGFFDAFNIGVASTAMMLASVFAGERDRKSLIVLDRFAMIVGVIIGFLKMAIIYIFAKRIGIIFGAEGEVIDMFADLFKLYSWSMPLNMIYGVLTSTFCATGKVTLVNIFHGINAMAVPMLCIFILPKFIGVTGIWLCYSLAEVVSLTVLFVITLVKTKKVPKTINDYLDLPEDFEPEVKYSKSIKTIEEVIGISEDIDKLCKENNIDSKRAYYASLCTEEMAGNIVEHGFLKDNKENTVDVLAFIENGDINIRFRDNCVPFNPNDKLNVKDDEPLRNIGIRMVNKIAKEMNYQTTFGLNVLSIKL